MKDQQPKLDLTAVGNPHGLTARLAGALAAVSEPLMAVRLGRNYPGRLLVPGGIVWLAWIVAFPGYGEELTGAAAIWLAALALQWLMANWSFHFGRAQQTDYVGFPILAYVIPFGEKFVRRWINPVALYSLSDLVGCPPLALLMKASALGQVVVWYYAARVDRADEDAKFNAQWEGRNR